MKGFLVKRWFLLLLIVGVFIVGLAPDWLRWTKELDPAVTGALAILLSAWSLETRSLRNAVAHPQPALWATVISYALLPGLGWLFSLLLAEPDYRIGLLLVASVPCTLASAVIWTRLAGGDEATALLVTLVTNCTGWFFTTGWLTLVAGRGELHIDAAPMMIKLLQVLVVPVAAGQLLRAIGPLRWLATTHKVTFGVVARLLTLLIMLRAAIDVRDRLGGATAALSSGSLLAVALVCLALHLAALFAGMWSSKLLGFNRANQIAVAIAGSQKTLPVSLILFDAYFNPYTLAVIPMVFYHFGQLIADTFIADHLAGQSMKETGIPEDPLI